MSILIPQFFIMILPFIACKYTKGNVKEVYRLKRPTVKNLFAGIILYLGFFGLSYISGDLIERVFPGKLGGATQGVTDITSQAPVFVAFLLIAFLPAVSEELLFRGYLMTAFSGKYKMLPNCVITALLFGVMHLSLPRLLPLVLLGFCNCYAAYKSKSLIVSIIMHLINNSYSVFALYFSDKISFIATEGLMDLKSYIICIGLTVVCIPVGLLMYRKKEKSVLVL